jgi:hypothetical protein
MTAPLNPALRIIIYHFKFYGLSCFMNDKGSQLHGIPYIVNFTCHSGISYVTENLENGYFDETVSSLNAYNFRIIYFF